jgi:hypothetical protein
MAELRATPMSNPVMGLLADRLKKVQQFGAKPFGYENPPVEMLMNLLGVPAVQQTMERMAYGEPLTTGRGMTTKPRPEALEAAMTLLPASVGAAKATKGLPVGASIKPINLEKGIYKPDLTMEEMLKVRDIPTVERVQKSVELVGEKQFEKMVDAQFKKYKPSSPEQEAMLVESITLQILGKAERSPFPRQEALDTAQRNAALPIEEGGLGLPKDNTPEMRATAMGFDLSNPQYHATNVPEDFTSIRPSSRGKMGAGIYTSPEAQYAEKYGGRQDVRILPMVSRGKYADSDTRENIFDMAREELYLKNPNFTSQELHNAASKEMQKSGYSGFDVDKERVTFRPDEMRSRFAAFDPFRMNTETASARGVAPPDLLAGVLPLGLLADEEQRKKLYELMPSLLGQ